jgi:uncharacterized protein (DUF4415 family)
VTIIKFSLDEIRASTQDWAHIDALTDAEIEAAVADDPDAAPILDEDWFRSAAIEPPITKQPTSIRLDADILDWFRGQGRGWQTRINAVLRAYAKAHGGVK